MNSAKAKRSIMEDPRVAAAYEDPDPTDGVWVVLKSGYTDGSNPGCHCIHEWRWTKALAMLRGVVPCRCVDCKLESGVAR